MKENTTTYILTQFSDDDDEDLDQLLKRSKNTGGWFNDRRKGILFTIIGALFSSTASVSIKLAEQVVPVLQVLWFKFIVMFVLVGSRVLYTRQELNTEGRLLYLFIRSCCENTAMSLVLFAVMYLPVGEATVVMFFSMSIFMVLMAAVVLKEPLTCRIYLALLLGLSGVFLLANPEELIVNRSCSVAKLYGLGAGIGHGLFRAMSSIMVRKLGSKVHSNVVIFYHSVYGLAIFTVLILIGILYSFIMGDYLISESFFIKIDDSFLLSVCISIGVLMFVCQSFATKGTQICDSSIVATVRNVCIVFSFVYQVLVFGEMPTLYAGIGTVLIGLAIGLIVTDK